ARIHPHAQAILRGGGVDLMAQFPGRHVPDEFAGGFRVDDGIFAVSRRALIRRKHDDGWIERDVLKLAERRKIVDALRTGGGNPSDGAGNDAGFKTIERKSVTGNSGFVEHQKMAERVGFEPTLEFPLNTLSKRAPSTTRPPLQGRFAVDTLQRNLRISRELIRSRSYRYRLPAGALRIVGAAAAGAGAAERTPLEMPLEDATRALLLPGVPRFRGANVATGPPGRRPVAGAIGVGRRVAVVPRRGSCEEAVEAVLPMPPRTVCALRRGMPVVAPLRAPPPPFQ